MSHHVTGSIDRLRLKWTPWLSFRRGGAVVAAVEEADPASSLDVSVDQASLVDG